jgi:hypothetical protein
VRTETNNKYTIIGATPTGNIQVTEFPATFLMSFYIEALCNEVGKQSIKIAMSYNKQRLGILSVQMDVVDVKLPAIIVFPTIPIPASGPGVLELYVENGDRYRIFKESVRLTDQLLSATPPL